MSSASVIYDKVNSLAPAFERTQPATLLLGLKIWLLDMTGGTCGSMAAPYRALHARTDIFNCKNMPHCMLAKIISSVIVPCFVDKNAVHGKNRD